MNSNIIGYPPLQAKLAHGPELADFLLKVTAILAAQNNPKYAPLITEGSVLLDTHLKQLSGYVPPPVPQELLVAHMPESEDVKAKSHKK